MKETFQCPSCGQKNNIEWDKDETSRTIPCLGCYGETWDPAVPDEESRVLDPKKGIMVYTRMLTDAVKVPHGSMLVVERGKSPSCRVK